MENKSFKKEIGVCSPQVHREDHRRRDVVLPHGHHQGFHLQPVPSRPHLQAEEHQQAGADPPQPAACIQVRRAFSQMAGAEMLSAPTRGNLITNLT